MNNIFKIGDIVKLKSSSSFYSFNTPTNPKDINGMIYNINYNGVINVEWNNDEINIYNEKDLDLIERFSLDIKSNLLSGIYFKNFIPNTIEEALNYLLITQNTEKFNYYNISSKQSTYYKFIVNNVEHYLLQCSRNKYRSYDDIYEIIKTYFPDITDEILIKKLLLLNYDKINSKCNLGFHHCSDIDRIRVFCNINGDNKNTYMTMISSKKLSSKYSWEELLNMININSFRDFENFLKNN